MGARAGAGVDVGAAKGVAVEVPEAVGEGVDSSRFSQAERATAAKASRASAAVIGALRPRLRMVPAR